jgi:hypothetical protein
VRLIARTIENAPVLRILRLILKAEHFNARGSAAFFLNFLSPDRFQSQSASLRLHAIPHGSNQASNREFTAVHQANGSALLILAKATTPARSRNRRERLDWFGPGALFTKYRAFGRKTACSKPKPFFRTGQLPWSS